MQEMELLELYQLLRMYKWAYPDRSGDIEVLMGEVREKFERGSHGKDIERATNPRGAGRKRKYTDEQDQEILRIYKETKRYRKTAQQAGCSIGHVQDVVNRERNRPG